MLLPSPFVIACSYCLALGSFAACGDGEKQARKPKDTIADAPIGVDVPGTTPTDVATDPTDAPAASAGMPDPQFGTAGIATFKTAKNDDRGRAVAVLDDGRLLVAGKSKDDFIILRTSIDGALDTGFGTQGFATTDFKSGYDEAKSFGLLAGGAFVLGGITTRDGDADFGLAKYDANGRLDLSVSDDGKAAASFGAHSDEGKAVVVLSDGDIVMAGQTSDGSQNDFALARFDGATGALDENFGTAGKVTFDFGGKKNDEGNAIRRHGDGLVVAGYSATAGNEDFAVARFGLDGEIDGQFGSSGKTTTSVGDVDIAFALAVQDDQKIVLAGVSFEGATPGCAVARYSATGALDADFGKSGIARFRPVDVDFTCTALAIDSVGRIVVAGTARQGNDASFAVLRFDTMGELDPSFAGVGVSYVSIGPADGAYAMALQSEDRMVVVGETKFDDDVDIAVLRFLGR